MHIGTGFDLVSDAIDTFCHGYLEWVTLAFPNVSQIRRRVPSPELGKMVVCPPELMVALIQKQLMLATNLRALYVRVNQKAQALSGERRGSALGLTERRGWGERIRVG